jgi:hypothetical protein
MLLELLDKWGRQVVAELIVRTRSVEVRCQDKCYGIADRDLLANWLREPEGAFAYDDLMWLRTGNGIALALDDKVLCWPLQDYQVRSIRECV